MKLHRIWGRIFVSGHTKNLHQLQAMNILRRDQIKTVFCVASQKDPDLENVFTFGGPQFGSYIHWPMSDGSKIDPKIHDLAQQVIDAQERGHVLVHCRAGRNRSCFVIALAMVKSGSMTGAEAIKIIREIRPNALANLYFEKYLLES